MRAAQIENGMVVNFAEVGGFDGVRFIDPLDSVIGSTWDGVEFTNPPPPPLPTLDRHITVLAFRNRFTQAEKVAIDLASLDNPAAPMAARQQAAMVRVYLADTNAAAWIDLDRADTRAGVQAMEIAGLLAAGRALAILDAEVQMGERPAVK